MGMPVRIEDELYENAKTHAKVECRTIAGQIEFWAKIGKAALDNPDLPAGFVRDLLIARAEGRENATPVVSPSLQRKQQSDAAIDRILARLQQRTPVSEDEIRQAREEGRS